MRVHVSTLSAADATRRLRTLKILLKILRVKILYQVWVTLWFTQNAEDVPSSVNVGLHSDSQVANQPFRFIVKYIWTFHQLIMQKLKQILKLQIKRLSISEKLSDLLDRLAIVDRVSRAYNLTHRVVFENNAASSA